MYIIWRPGGGVWNDRINASINFVILQLYYSSGGLPIFSAILEIL